MNAIRKAVHTGAVCVLFLCAQACSFVYLKEAKAPAQDDWKITVLSLEDHGKYTFVDMGWLKSSWYRTLDRNNERFIVARILIENKAGADRELGYTDFKLGKEIPAYAFKGLDPRPPGRVAPPKALRFKVPAGQTRWLHLLFAISSFREPGYFIMGPGGRIDLPNRPGNVPFYELPVTGKPGGNKPVPEKPTQAPSS